MEPTDAVRVQTVVLDAGPAIHLDEIDCLHLLADFKRIIVPKAVSLEIEYHRSAVFQKNITFDKADAVIAETIHTACKLFSLDTGETEAIALCFNNPAAVLLTDDASARLAARTLGIRAYGTIGVLLRAIRRGLISPSDAISKLEEIPFKSTLFIKHSLLREIIEEVKITYGLG